MKSLYSLYSFLSFPLKRLRHHFGLSISSLIGIVSVLSLVICIPVFTNGILSNVLKQQLTDKAVRNHRSLFGVHAHYADLIEYTPLTVGGAHSVGQYIEDRLSHNMGLKVDSVALELNTNQFAWKAEKTKATRPPFQAIYLSFMSNNLLPDKARLVEGTWPQAGGDPSGPVPVAVEESFADNNFLNVGDIYQSVEGLRAQVVGIFRVTDPADPAWFYTPDITFKNVLWVPEGFFQDRLAALIKRPVYNTSWYVVADDSSLRFKNSLEYSHAMLQLENDLKAMLPNLSVDYSPLDMLKAYESRMQAMLVLFYAAGAPMAILALLFTGLVASLAVRQYESEVAVLNARGESAGQGILLNLVESLALVIVSLPISFVMGWLGAVLMGQTELFLRFTHRVGPSFSLRDINLTWLGIACLGVILARFLPLLGAKRASIVHLRQEQSRTTQKPAWQRLYLDFLLLIPAGYAYYAIQKGTSVKEGQYDPLMFVASSLFAIAACMLVLRVFPLVVRLAGKLVDRLPHPWSFLAVHEIARSPRDHSSAMLLVMISLSFSIFSASMAKTLDRWMYDSQYYKTGTDLVVKEYEVPVGRDQPAAPASAEQTQQKAVETLISIDSHTRLPGIQNATLVGSYPCKLSIGSESIACNVMGIDRLTFPSAAFYRQDFADVSLGALMNILATHPLGVLISKDLADKNRLKPGDPLRLEAQIGSGMELHIFETAVAGIYNYFPTVYPSETPTLIANLEGLFGAPEYITDVNVWLRLRKGTTVRSVLDEMRQLAGRQALIVEVQGNAIDAVQELIARPEWVGLFGVLNVGFLLTGILPAIGFVLYTYASLKRRLVQYGILQALGLSTRQAAYSLVLEQFLLVVAALAGGAGVGFAASALFVPFLQISATGSGTPVPPFEVLIGWGEAGWLCLAFGFVFLITLGITMTSLVKFQIFQAVKLGEEA